MIQRTASRHVVWLIVVALGVGCTGVDRDQAESADLGVVELEQATPTQTSEASDIETAAGPTPDLTGPEALSDLGAGDDTQGVMEGKGPQATRDGQEVERIIASPIDTALGYLTDVDELKRYLDSAVQEHAGLLVTCMRERGWTDFTFRPLRAYSETDFLGSPYQRSATELLQFGYGPVFNVATSLEQLAARVDFEANPQPPPSSSGVQSEAEVQARYADEGFCYDYAAENAPSLPNQVPIDVQQIVFDFRESVMASEPVQLVWSEWSTCMASAGFLYADRAQIAQGFQEQVGPVMARVQGAGLSTDQAQLAELKELVETAENLEAQVIEADLDCGEETSLDERIIQILFDAETKFVADNNDRLLAAAG